MEILLIIYMFISLGMLKNNTLLNKQIIWYLIGFILFYICKKIKLKYIYNIIIYTYIIVNFLLLYLLLFGDYVNGARVWINLGFISIQPSEFMKIILIVLLSMIKNKKIIIQFIIVLIPSILTFLEPDTGNVIFYVLILVVNIFINNKKLLIKPIIICSIFITIFISLYFINNNLFISIFGTSFFYRFDRIVNLFNNTSYQLNEAKKGMGCSFLFGFNKNIYIPASITDFAFASIIIHFGLIGGIIYLIINYIFNNKIIKIIKDDFGIKKNIEILAISVKIVQEMIHILMNIGMFPIIGITLPFISYGGSSIITYFIIFGIISNCNNKADLEQGYNKQVLV